MCRRRSTSTVAPSSGRTHIRVDVCRPLQASVYQFNKTSTNMQLQRAKLYNHVQYSPTNPNGYLYRRVHNFISRFLRDTSELAIVNSLFPCLGPPLQMTV